MELVAETRIGPAGRAALHLLACCPRMPTDVMAVLLGHRQRVTTAQLLARLRLARLAGYEGVELGPLLGSGPARLWSLTKAGRALIAGRGTATPNAVAPETCYGEPERWHDPAGGRGIPLLVACYRLLARVAGSLVGPVRVCSWEHPWIRTLAPPDGARRRHVRLPAAAVLQTQETDGGHWRAVLLLPDLGTAPLHSYRASLRALIDLRRLLLTDQDQEPVLVVGVATSRYSSSARIQAWRSLLQDVARRADEPSLRAHLLTCGTGLGAVGKADERHLTGQLDALFALVARHPLLTRQQLATLLRTSRRRVARLEEELLERGWLRPVASRYLPRAVALTACQVRHLGLVELTETGRREASRRLLVPAALARRRHGVSSSDASMRRFIRHSQHTLGANAVFVAFVSAAHRMFDRGGDEALEEWRSAAACARGRFRPDGYGCYRRASHRFGFFVEFDRGTERPGQYAAKLATYYRYLTSGAFLRDFDSFPSLLVVCTSDSAEARFARASYLAEQRYGASLRTFLTTTERIRADPYGPLGPIWRAPCLDAHVADQPPIHWLPSFPHAP
jgi:hypothetical protein